MAEQFGVKSLTAAQRAKLTGFKRTISSLADQFAIFRAKVKDIAKPIMEFHDDLLKAHGAQMNWVIFCRLFDPSMPEKAGTASEPGYRQNKTYYTLDYIKRTTMRRKGNSQGKKDPATDQFARTIATILQVFKDDTPVWAAVAKEFGLTDRAISRLKTRVEDAEPILDLSDVKPIGTAKVIHMEPIKKPQPGVRVQQPGQVDLRAGAQRVRVQARAGRKAG